MRDAFGRGNPQALSYPPAGSMQEPAPPETLGETPADEPVEPPARPTGLHAPTVTHHARVGGPTGRQHHHLHGPTAASDGANYGDGQGSWTFEGIATTGSADTAHTDASVEPRRR